MSKTKLIILSAAAVGCLLTFGVAFAMLASSPANQADKQLDIALKLLDEGRWDLADRIARDLSKSEHINSAREPVYRFIRGASGVVRTEDKVDSPGSRKIISDSIEHLAAARELGFPIGYRGKGTYYLGFCYYHTFNWDQALEILPEAIEAWPQRRSDAYEMLIQSSLKKSPSEIEQAKSNWAKWSAIGGMSDEEKNRARFSQAQIAMSEKNWPQCDSILATLAGDPQDSFDVMVMSGRNAFEQASWLAKESDPNANDLFSQALSKLQAVAAHPEIPAVLRRQATFLVGRCLRQLRRLEEALSVFSVARQLNPHSPEAIASAVEEAEIEVLQGKFDAATEIGRHISVNIGDLKNYDQSWMNIAELQNRLLEIGRQLQATKNFELTIRLAGYLVAVLPKPDLVRLQAETYEHWAENVGAVDSSPLPGDEGLETLPKPPAPKQDIQFIRERYGHAAQQYQELAKLEIKTPAYPELMWQAIECYRKSDQPESVNTLLPEYILAEKDSERPRGYIALAESYISRGQLDKALPQLLKCIENHADHPAIYEARLLTSRVYNQQNRNDEAQELLLQNLYDGSLHPESKIWRDSLFELGDMLYQQGNRISLQARSSSSNQPAERLDKLKRGHDELLNAVQRLSEAVGRFQHDERSTAAMYAICKSYVQAANYPQQALELSPSLADSDKRALNQQRRTLLENALDSYVKLRESLVRSQEQTELSPEKVSTLRNCFFGEADVLFALKRYEEAIRSYRNVGNRFMNQPESLEALVQIFQCYRNLGQTDQAKRILTQAEQVLGRIPAEQDSRFAQVTRSPRDQWPGLLGWLKQL